MAAATAARGGPGEELAHGLGGKGQAIRHCECPLFLLFSSLASYFQGGWPGDASKSQPGLPTTT